VLQRVAAYRSAVTSIPSEHTGVDTDVNFERRAPPGFRPPKADNSKFDSRIFEISQRFILAQQSDVIEVAILQHAATHCDRI